MVHDSPSQSDDGNGYRTDARAMEPSWAKATVERLYQMLLGRGLDDEACSDKVARLTAGTATIVDIVAEIISSAEYRLRLADPIGPGSNGRFTNDHSQFGEIWLIIREMVNESAQSRWVVDVGARGRDRSNSFDLLREFGWRGLLVEANPNLLQPIAQEFGGLDVRIVGAAVSDFAGRATLTIGVNDDVSSLSVDAAQGWGETRGNVEVDVVRLPELLRAHDVPRRFGLLSIDIEGEDVKVLNDLIDRSAYRPDWIIIEASYDFATTSLADVGASQIVQSNYGIAAQTTANLILRHVGRDMPASSDTSAEASSPASPLPAFDTDRPDSRSASGRPDSAMAGERLRALGRLLTPRAVRGYDKIRVGGDGDGGYVMLDDLDGIRAAFSLGVGDDVSWDRQIADRGITVHQFDPTVSGPPEDHRRYVFRPLCVSAKDGEGAVTIATLHQVAGLDRHAGVGRPGDLLKIDIEHAEWAAIAAATPGDFESYRQILCEFHNFERIYDEDWSAMAFGVLSKLHDGFQCIHVHGNNCAPFPIIGGTAFPSVLEVTLANRAMYRFQDDGALYPTSFDHPNNPAEPDYRLGRFEF